MNAKRLFAAGAFLSAVALGLVIGATSDQRAKATTLALFSGPNCQEASQQLACMNQLILSINSAFGNVPSWANARNFIDNGSMAISQRGTGAATCALNGAAITSAAYAADRWGCQVNVAVGAGQLTTITATPAPPPGFSNALKLVRNSGALLQPQCVYQEVPTYKATQLQGQQVIFSSYVQALAGLAADQGTATQTVNFLVITGTGSDQGLGTWTASPALTPAWTGVATQVNTSIALPATPIWTRYSTTALIPTTATEIAVAICFTPTAAGAGTTDGFAFTGTQLEQGAVVSPYEFRAPGAELAEAQRYFYRLTETAAITPIATCSAVDTTHTNCLVQFPVTMRTVPTMTYAAGFASPTSTTQATLGACSALASAATVASTAVNALNALVNCTATTIPAAGIASFLYGNGGTGTITASADF